MSWLYKGLGLAFNAADAMLPKALLPGLAPAALIRAAKAEPLPAAREGLTRLLEAIEADSQLSFFGHVSLRWDMIRLLRNAQWVDGAHRANPALGEAPITAPVFILGLPRSGTSFLHDLMARDEDNLVPRNWQTIYPAPRPAGFDAAKDRRARIVERQFQLFADLAPGFAQLHPVGADSPQECSEITSQVFQSLRFDTNFRVPRYFEWMEAQGHDAAFAYHKRFLQLLQDGTPRQWVLKCPDHTFTLDAILKTYPDARFVIVHRDPIAVLGSVAHLTCVLRKPFLKNIDPAEIGAQVARRWIEGANLLVKFGARADVPASRKLHLHYDDLTRAPLAAIARIYAQFDLPLSSAALAAMSRQLAAKPGGGYAKHAPYSLDRYEINLPDLRAAFEPYTRRYCAGG